MKYFLLIAGENYYPSSGTDDWIGTFETLEEAQNKVYPGISRIVPKDVFIINGCEYDWYEIVDLREWINR